MIKSDLKDSDILLLPEEKNYFSLSHSSAQDSGLGIDQGRFIIQTGMGHNGSKWLANVFDSMGEDFLGTHERKNEELGQKWFESLAGEIRFGVDVHYMPYFSAVESDLNKYKIVLDANSWPPFTIPQLNQVFPVDHVIYVVRNGLQMVNSVYQHDRASDIRAWLEKEYLGFYWHLLYRDMVEFNSLSSFAKWCFWWSLNEIMPEWLGRFYGNENLSIYRLEDLTGDSEILATAIKEATKLDVIPYSNEELKALQKKDINRKIKGKRTPDFIWSKWNNSQKEEFLHFCSSGMKKYRYQLPKI